MSKLRKYGIISVLVLAVMMLIPMSALAAVEVGTFQDLLYALENKAPDIILIDNFDSNDEVIINYNVTLDLNGFTINSAHDIIVGDGTTAGSLTLKNSKPGADGIIFKGTQNSASISVYGDYSTPVDSRKEIKSVLTVHDGVKISSEGYYCIYVKGKGATLDILGGEITSCLDLDSGAVLGNGKPESGGTVINISGGKLTGGNDRGGIALYHPQEGTLTISGGTLSGYDGVQLKRGTLNMTGGSIISTGEKPSVIEPNSNGSEVTGAAVSLITNSGYTGEIKLNISGNAKLTAGGSYAIWEATSLGDSAHTSSVEISGGTFKGTPAAMYYENWANANMTTKSITGGAYSSDPSAYVADGYDAIKNGDKYIVSKKTVEPVLPEGTPETVEPTTAGELTVVEATTDMITSDSAAITADDLEIKDGVVVAKETVVKAAAEKAIESAGLNVEVESVVPLPVFACTVSPDKIAAVSFSFQGSELKAATAGAVKVLKILGSDDGKFFTFQSEAANVDDGEFALQSDSGDFMASTDAIDANETYTLILFIKDNGDFDLNDTPGTVVDPAAIVETTAGSHSSSGCNVGFAGLLLMAAVPMIVWRKKQ